MLSAVGGLFLMRALASIRNAAAVFAATAAASKQRFSTQRTTSRVSVPAARLRNSTATRRRRRSLTSSAQIGCALCASGVRRRWQASSSRQKKNQKRSSHSTRTFQRRCCRSLASTIATTMHPLVCSFARSSNDHSRSSACRLVRTRLQRARMRWRRLCVDGDGCERLLLAVDESQLRLYGGAHFRIAAAEMTISMRANCAQRLVEFVMFWRHLVQLNNGCSQTSFVARTRN